MAAATKLSPAVFSNILSHIWDTKVLYTLVDVFPVKHKLFWPTVKRLMDFPVFFCTDDDEESDQVSLSVDTLDALTGEDGEALPLDVEKLRNSIKHITLHGSGWEGRIPVFEDDDNPSKELVVSLLRLTKNLRSINCENEILLNEEAFRSLNKYLPNLDTLIGDCTLPGSHDEGYGWEGTAADALVKHFGEQIRYIHLERISIGPWSMLEEHAQKFAKLKSLSRVYLDLTEGPWDEEDCDWDHLNHDGTIQDYPFKELGFPALTHIEMRAIDFLLVQERIGVMELAKWENVQNVSLTVQRGYSLDSKYNRNIRVFDFLTPERFSLLKQLEIHDIRRWKKSWNWSGQPDEDVDDTKDRPDMNEWTLQMSRCYWGFVPKFLAGVQGGEGLQNLTHLWVNEQMLCMPKGTFKEDADFDFYTVQQLWERNNDEEENQRKEEWVAVIRSVSERLESLRVGFGAMTVAELGLILDCCSKDRLKQIGFQYLWAIEDKDKVLPQGILDHLSGFQSLTDVHILHPRPGTQETYTSPSPTKNAITFQDVVAIFKVKPTVCYVGVGNAVWQRNCLPHSDELELASLAWDMYSDPRGLAVDSVPRFFKIPHADTWSKISENHCSRNSPLKEMQSFQKLLGRLQRNKKD